MKTINSSGKRKRAIASATLKEGTGVVRVNGILLENYEPKLSRQKIKEPIMLAGAKAGKFDISVRSHGGGVISQADAIRLAIARGLAEIDKSLEDTFENYDRRLLVADVRRKEARKPNNHGKARAKRQKSYR